MPTREHGLPSAAVRVEDMIVAVRGERVILDRDLARLYDVTTKALNEAVKRNPGRFPSEFMFRLTSQEVADLKSQSVTSRAGANRSQVVTVPEKHRNPRFPPYAFTEHGALMAANVLRSPQAVDMSVFVVRAFVRLRRPLAYHADLAHRLDGLEKKYDARFKVVFDAIRQLMTPVAPRGAPPGSRSRRGIIADTVGGGTRYRLDLHRCRCRISLSAIPVAPSVPQAAAERPAESVSLDRAHAAEGREQSRTGTREFKQLRVQRCPVPFSKRP